MRVLDVYCGCGEADLEQHRRLKDLLVCPVCWFKYKKEEALKGIFIRVKRKVKNPRWAHKRLRETKGLLVALFLLLTVQLGYIVQPVLASGDYERNYTIHDDYGYSKSFTMLIPRETYQGYKGLSHRVYSYDDYEKFVTPEMFTEIVPRISEICTTDRSFIMAALEIAQQIPYEYHDTELYPVETMVENAGDCSDKSYIAASILVAKGYYTILLCFELDDEGHIAIGVAASIFEVDYSAYYWEYEGKDYYFCECTSLGWRIGELPSDLEGEGAIIIDVGGYRQARIKPTQQSSTISCSLSSTSVVLGDGVSIWGSVSVLRSVSVTITIYKDGSLIGTKTTWASGGTYSYTWIPIEAGSYKIKASWKGNDEYLGATSPYVYLTVTEPEEEPEPESILTTHNLSTIALVTAIASTTIFIIVILCEIATKKIKGGERVKE